MQQSTAPISIGRWTVALAIASAVAGTICGALAFVMFIVGGLLLSITQPISIFFLDVVTEPWVAIAVSGLACACLSGLLLVIAQVADRLWPDPPTIALATVKYILAGIVLSAAPLIARMLLDDM